MGLLTENMAAAHLHALGQLAQVRVYHWRYQNDEVDLIFDHPEYPMAFEIASSARHSRTGMRRFLAEHPRFHGRCYIVAPEIAMTNAASSSDGIGTVPLDLYLIAVSAQAALELRRRLGA
jgi:predicted AAA+ superfamily ATPase